MAPGGQMLGIQHNSQGDPRIYQYDCHEKLFSDSINILEKYSINII